MKIVDDRTKEEKKTHVYLICGTDSFMSGWGRAKNGVSYAVWACKPEHLSKVKRWVESRSEMKRVRLVTDPYKPKGKGHCHIYVVNDNHPSVV